MMYGRGIFSNGGCFGYGFMNSGWSWLIVIGLVLAIVAVTYLVANSKKNADINSNALETLKMKFAQGEITEEQYKQRKSVLESKK